MPRLLHNPCQGIAHAGADGHLPLPTKRNVEVAPGKRRHKVDPLALEGPETPFAQVFHALVRHIHDALNRLLGARQR